MQYQWILDVLQDLRSFATENGLQELAEHLGDTSLVAAAEIAQAESGAVAHGETAGRLPCVVAVRDNA